MSHTLYQHLMESHTAPIPASVLCIPVKGPLCMAKSLHRFGDYSIPPICLTSILLTAGGVVFGYIVGWLLRHNLLAAAQSTFEELFQTLEATSIRHAPLFFLCAKQQLKQFALLLFFSLTNAWLCYLCCFLLYTGVSNGLLLCFCVQLGGQSGWWDYCCFLLPQCLLYIPVYLILITKFHELRRSAQKKQSLLSGLPLLLLCLLFLGLGCIAETFLNPPLLQWYQGL